MIRGLVAVDRAPTVKPFEPVVRERLLARLERAARYPITIVSAPAGFGKTVAIRQFLETANREHVRFGLRREHANLVGFVRGIVETIEAISPNALQSLAGVLERAEKSKTPAADISTWLAKLLESYRGTFVLDDLHVAAADEAVAELVEDLIGRTCDSMQWLISTRDTLELPIASWLAYAKMDMPIDEVDLRLTLEEAIATAADAEVHIRDNELNEILLLTEGWPTAFAFALRASMRTADFRRVAAGTREMVYGFLAEQVYRGLPEEDRAFLRDTAVLPALELAVFEAAGRDDAPKYITRLRRRTAFVAYESEGIYKYHDLFRDFLEYQLKKEGSHVYAAATASAGLMLERAGRIADALRLFVQAGSTDDVVRLLETHGTDLYDRGHIEELRRALQSLSAGIIDRSAYLLGLQAYIFSFSSNFEQADLYFNLAREQSSDPELTGDLIHRHSSTMLNQGRKEEAVEIFSYLGEEEIKEETKRARFIASKAFALSSVGRSAEAKCNIDLAIKLLARIDDALSRSLILQRAAAVYHALGMFEKSTAYAEQSINLSETAGHYSHSARTASFVFLCAYEVGDRNRCKLALAQIIKNADRAGDQLARWFATINSYEFHVEEGDQEALFQLERELQNLTSDGTSRSLTFYAAFALQSAWFGDFGKAYALMAACSSTGMTAERLSMHSSLKMLYAALANLRAESEAAADEYLLAFSLGGSSKPRSSRAVKARCFYALASILLNRAATCNNVLQGLESSTIQGRDSHLIKAIRAIYVQIQTKSSASVLHQSLASLRKCGLGGYAKLIEAIKLPEHSSTPFSNLTQTELRILQLIADGNTSRTVALELERSVQTVESHIKSFIKKLDCSGRREAVAVAKAHGIIA